MPDELRQQPKEGSPRVLPKLAMLRSRTAQAVVRRSEVDDRGHRVAIAKQSICRSEAISRAVAQLAISEHHIYDI